MTQQIKNKLKISRKTTRTILTAGLVVLMWMGSEMVLNALVSLLVIDAIIKDWFEI